MTARSDRVQARLAGLRARIDDAAERAGRDPAEVTLVAVSKTRSRDEILAAFAAGVTVFGENRVQEAAAKSALGWPDGLVLRMVGHLQKNKVKDAVRLFDAIDSVDDARTLQRLDRLATVPREVLLQVKLSDEPHKSGAAPDELPALLQAAAGLTRVRVRGLMLVPPLADSPEPYFRRLVELRDELGGAARLPELSIGMSRDFELAIAAGATMVRLGEAVFGPRRRGPAHADRLPAPG